MKKHDELGGWVTHRIVPRIILTSLLASFVLSISTCTGSTPGTPGYSLRLFDHTELMGSLNSESIVISRDWEILDVKLGTLVHRAVEFPANGNITIDLKDFPLGAAFTCSIGAETESETPPSFNYRIYAFTPDGTEFDLAEGSSEPDSPSQWLPVEALLASTNLRDVTGCIEIVNTSVNAEFYLANPRIDLPGTRKPNQVIVVCIDTFRADVLGCYGDPHGITPNLDQLAKNAIRFENCEAPGSWTFPSVSATLTGLYSEFVIPSRGIRYVRPDVTTLSEIFYENGYSTASMTSNVHPTMEFGFFQGYEYLNELRNEPAEVLVQDALDWISARSDRDFFIYLHLNDPHHPYKPIEPFLSRIRRGEGRFDVKFALADWKALKEYGMTYPPLTQERIKSLWEAEVAYADDQVGVLMDGLKELQIWNNAVFTVYGDHGEEFWDIDHGEFGHAHTVYEELSHVPLIMKIPGTRRGVRTDRIGLIDLVPTLAGWAGLEISTSLSGLDILSQDYDRDSSRTFYIERGATNISTEIYGGVLGDWKGIVYFDGITDPELFNLADDPGEQVNLFDDEPDLSEKLISDLIAQSAQKDIGTHVTIYPTGDTWEKVYRVTVEMQDGILRDPTPLILKGEIHSELVEDNRLVYEMSMRSPDGDRRGVFTLTFFPEPEDAVFTLTVNIDNYQSANIPWIVGDSIEAAYPGQLTISSLDPEIAMAFPQALLRDRQGVFIWSVPPSMTQFDQTLSQETLDELAALGYIQ